MAPDDAADVDLDLLRSSARDFLADRGEKDSVEDLAQLDWTSLLVDEQYGGAGWRFGLSLAGMGAPKASE